MEHDGSVVSVIKAAASQWESIATRLYFEGYSISTIKRDNSHSVQSACHAVFTDWVRGVDQLREPRTWRTVLKVLNEAELSEISKKVENALTHKQISD